MTDFKCALSPDDIKKNFADIAPDLAQSEALVEASRCLFCYDAPCIKACPTKIDIPTFIRQIASSDPIGAAKTIFTQNILGGSCGRACPTSVLCEGACVYNDINKKPIEIGRLQKFASDQAISKNARFFQKGKPTGKKVAVVGAGPAGLSAAHELTKLGHDVTVYEAEGMAGGLNTFGLAGYKIETEFALAEAEYVKAIGFEIVYNTRIGDKISLRNLMESNDAVLLAFGLGSTAKLGIPGEESSGVLEALQFIRPTREPGYKNVKVGKNVAVLGAGNTAIDAATAAARLGAESTTIIYRRTADEMPAFKYEYELAKGDGVQFLWKTAPLEVLTKAGRVCGLKCAKVELPPKGSKDKPRVIPGSEFVYECDMIIKALGQDALTTPLAEISGLNARKGILEVSPSYATSVPGLFAAGDCTNGGGEVVDAVEHGKIAARGIDRYLAGGNKRAANL